jgi:protein arginine kinase activator
MLCEECKKRKAVINFTQIIDNKVTTSHLCESCAEKKGIGGQVKLSAKPLNNFISHIGSQLQEEKEKSGGSAEEKTCPSCGSTFKEFQETGKLGCPRCYFTFEQELGILLRRIQGSQVHVGKGPRRRKAGLSTHENRLLELRKLLEESVSNEEYERAAILRDEIRTLEETNGSEGEGEGEP